MSDFCSKRIRTHSHACIHFLLGRLSHSAGLNASLRNTEHHTDTNTAGGISAQTSQPYRCTTVSLGYHLGTLKKKEKKAGHISICISYLGCTTCPASAFSPSLYPTFFSYSEFSEANLLAFEFRSAETHEQKQQSVSSSGCARKNALCFKFWPERLQNVVGSYTF